MRFAILLCAAVVLAPGAAAAKFVNLSCADADSALLLRVDTDAKVIQMSGADKRWNILTNTGITDSQFSGTIPLANGGSRQLTVDRASGELKVVMEDGAAAKANCTVTTFPNKF